MSENSIKKTQLLVVGIDGASYTLIKCLLNKGQLPHLRSIAERGVSGVLQSTFPPHTAPGWASMFTGVEPGEHGIFQFWKTQPGDYTAQTVNATEYGREPIWQTLVRLGKKVGVYNVPMTHPPQKLAGGYMISWPLSPTLRYTEPPELVSELAAAGLHHHSDIVTMYRGQDDYLEQAATFIDGRTQACLHLQKTRPVEALFVVFTEIDRISHHYWGNAETPDETVIAAYHDMDRALGELMKLTDENTLVLVTSDHGFGVCRKDLNVHTLLSEAGLLHSVFQELPSQHEVDRTYDDTSVTSWFDSPTHYKRSVDWSRTLAYMPTPGCFGINLNLKGRDKHGIVKDGAHRQEVENRLKNAFSALLDDDGEPFFKVAAREEVYSGKLIDKAPDYLLLPKRWDIMPTPALKNELWSPPAQLGVHQPDGILFTQGPNVPSDMPVLARIEDVTPFILAHLGLPVQTPITGHWLFEPDKPVVRENAVEQSGGQQLNKDEQAFMDKRLAEIGYL